MWRETIPKQMHTAAMWTKGLLYWGTRRLLQSRGQRGWSEIADRMHNEFIEITRSKAQRALYIYSRIHIYMHINRKRKPVKFFCHKRRNVGEQRNVGNHTNNRAVRIHRRRLWDNRLYRVLAGIIGTADTNYENKIFLDKTETET